jgi:uncharacterized phage protein (TIGR01671 family)
MKDRYLFRGQEVNSKNWVYGGISKLPKADDYEHAIINTEFIEGKEEDEYLITIPVKQHTVGQYTGLPDKNGNKIFEGDIAQWWLEDTQEDGGGKWVQVEVVKYMGCWCVMEVGRKEIYNTTDNRPELLFDMKDKLEVVGTIHD